MVNAEVAALSICGRRAGGSRVWRTRSAVARFLASLRDGLFSTLVIS
jgi:hypothetical protein